MAINFIYISQYFVAALLGHSNNYWNSIVYILRVQSSTEFVVKCHHKFSFLIMQCNINIYNKTKLWFVTKVILPTHFIFLLDSCWC